LTNQKSRSREGELTPVRQGKNLGPSALGVNKGYSMTIVRSVTMLSLARDALERSANDADAAQAYLSELLLNDGSLREALVKAAIEYEKATAIEEAAS
jgi:hypothetical protein